MPSPFRPIWLSYRHFREITKQRRSPHLLVSLASLPSLTSLLMVASCFATGWSAIPPVPARYAAMSVHARVHPCPCPATSPEFRPWLSKYARSAQRDPAPAERRAQLGRERRSPTGPQNADPRPLQHPATVQVTHSRREGWPAIPPRGRIGMRLPRRAPPKRVRSRTSSASARTPAPRRPRSR